MLELKEIVKAYQTASLVQVALNKVSVAFRDNEFVAVLGQSGSGKTTMLNVIGGLDRFQAGDLVIDGISTKDYKARDWDAYRNNRIGFVFQAYNLIPHQSVLANVELALTLSGVSRSERRKRAQLQSKPVYKYVALIISLFGVVSAAYGIQSIINHTGNYGIYFALFGFAAIFLFSSYNMMPTAHNNHNAIMKRADRAEAAMAEYIKAYPGGNFPVPDIYAHPVVLKQMTDALQEGRAVTLPEALEAVKNRLKEVNADVQVEQEEYDEIVQIKAMFLNHDYQ